MFDSQIPKELVINRKYHTTWQKDSGMVFILLAISEDGTKALLKTRKRKFWTNVKDLRNTNYNHHHETNHNNINH